MRKILLAGALALSATSAMAFDVNKATPQNIQSGGLNGSGPGCLYLTTDMGIFTLPFALPSPTTNPSPLSVSVAAGIVSHPLFGTVSFNLGAPNPLVCKQPGWEEAPTILGPNSP